MRPAILFSLVMLGIGVAVGQLYLWKFEKNYLDSSSNFTFSPNNAASVGFVQGVVGSAVRLTNARLSGGTSSHFRVTSFKFAASLWYRPLSSQADSMILFSRDGEYYLLRSKSGQLCYAIIWCSWELFCTPGILTLNRWSHISVTFDQPTLNVYLNGVLILTNNGCTSTAADFHPDHNDFRLGGREFLNPTLSWADFDEFQFNVGNTTLIPPYASFVNPTPGSTICNVDTKVESVFFCKFA